MLAIYLFVHTVYVICSLVVGNETDCKSVGLEIIICHPKCFHQLK